MINSDGFVEPPYTYCNDCEQNFDTSFDLVDHFLPEEEEFDPYYLLPNGYKLMLGSFLRFINGHADEPERIRHMVQSAYMTLFAAELGHENLEEIIQDVIISNSFIDFDAELKNLLEKESNDE